MPLAVRKPRTQKEGSKKTFKKFTVSIVVDSEDYGDTLSAAFLKSGLKDGAAIAGFIDSKM